MKKLLMVAALTILSGAVFADDSSISNAEPVANDQVQMTNSDPVANGDQAVSSVDSGIVTADNGNAPADLGAGDNKKDGTSSSDSANNAGGDADY